jgi:hypothetical protein
METKIAELTTDEKKRVKEILIPLLPEQYRDKIGDLIYNTDLEPLKIPEYGRVIHQMAKNLRNIKDRELRNRMAREIIRMMGRKSPHLRDVEDFQHKLWDHLFIMAGFDLDIDSPYEKPTEEKVRFKPARLMYPQKGYKYRFYGKIIHDLIRVATGWEDGEMKDLLIKTIANHMKKNYLNWNKDNVDDSVIFQHLYELSNGKINLSAQTDELLSRDELVRKRRYYHHRNNYHKKNYRK